jgi:hypothetical protein
LTKLCFEGIVAQGLCNLHDIADIPRNIILHVDSPDDIRIETEDGELVDEKFFKDYFGLSKKTFNVARQELIMQWSEEKDEERNDLIQIYRKSPKIKTIRSRGQVFDLFSKRYMTRPLDIQDW